MAKGIAYRRPKKSSTNRQGARTDLAENRKLRNTATANYQDGDDDENENVVDLPCDAAVIDTTKATRIMIACMLERDFGGILNNQIIKKIRIRSNVGPRYDVKAVLEEYLQYKALGIPYKGDRVGVLNNDAIGRPVILKTDSIEAQLVADSIENGVSLHLTHLIVNVHRKEAELDPVSFSAVYGLIQRMKPVTQRVAVHRQGSCDVGSKWAQARFLWCVQLLVRYGEIDFEGNMPADFECLSNYYDGTKPIPDYWDKTKLTPLSPYQQADWDEAHRQCTPGEGLGTSQKTTRLIFPRDSNGKIDLNGQYSKDQVTMMRVKYNDETRKAFGVAMVKPVDANGVESEAVGRRLKPFDYTCRNIKSIKDYSYLMKREMERVKSLGSDEKCGGGWFIKGREEGKVYADDGLTSVKGIGKPTAQKLIAEGITDVHQLSQLTFEEVNDIAKKIRGISKDKLFTWIAYAQDNYVDANAPPDIDYREADNPYKARYGNNWEEEIANCASMKPFVCVTTLIQHVYDETKRCFADTKYKDNFFFYHDALALMTNPRCRQWMDDQGILKHWILPEQGMFYDGDDLKAYRDRPIGNSPELNALDASCNKDIHEAVNRHVSLTLDLGDDTKKFSLATPEQASSAYDRIFDCIAPEEHRIIEDRSNIINSLKWIVHHQGAIVPDHELRLNFETKMKFREVVVALRDGHRRVTANGSQPKRKWGGSRKKTIVADAVTSKYKIHPDAMVATKAKMEYSKYLHDSSNKDNAMAAMEGLEFKRSVKAKLTSLSLPVAPSPVAPSPVAV